MGIQWRGDFIALSNRFGLLVGVVFDISKGCPVLASAQPEGDIFPALLNGKADIIFSAASNHLGDYGYNTRYNNLVPSWVVPNQIGGSIYNFPLGDDEFITFGTRVIRKNTEPPYVKENHLISQLNYPAAASVDSRCLLDFRLLPQGYYTSPMYLAIARDYGSLDYTVQRIYEPASGNCAWCKGYDDKPILLIHTKRFHDTEYYGDYHERYFQMILINPDSKSYTIKQQESLDYIADEYVELLAPIKKDNKYKVLRWRGRDSYFYLYDFSPTHTYNTIRLSKVGYFPSPYFYSYFLKQTGAYSRVDKWFIYFTPYWRGLVEQTEEGDFLVWTGGLPVVETWQAYLPPDFRSFKSSGSSFWQDKWFELYKKGTLSSPSPSFVGLYWLDYSNNRIVMVDFINKTNQPVFITNFMKIAPREYYLAIYNAAVKTTTLYKMTWTLEEKKLHLEPILTRKGVGFGYLGVAEIGGAQRLLIKQGLNSSLEVIGQGIAERVILSLEDNDSRNFPFTTNLHVEVKDIFGNNVYSRLLLRCETNNVSFADGTTQKIIKVFPGEEVILPVEIKRIGKVVITSKILETRL